MIEQSVSLASNGTAKLPGYEQLVRFGYTKNRGVYRLHVDASGEWEGLTIRAFWHVPDGKDPASSLVVDGYVAVPASVTAQPGNGCITFEGSDGTKTVTSADLRYRVSSNSGTEDGTTPEPGTTAWQQLVDAVHTDATTAEQAKTDAQTAAKQADTSASAASTSAGSADQSAQAAADSLQELKDGIASGDFKGEKGDKGDTGPIGPVGPQGAQGPQGEKGDTGPAVALDTTLTHEGEAADAKATGDAISAVKARQNILVGTEIGNPISVDDAFPAPLCGLTVYGRSTQAGTPTPDAPVPIVSAGDGGSVVVTLSDGKGKTQTLTLPTPNGLPGIPVTSGGNYTDPQGQQWVCDEVDLERGVKVQRIASFVIDAKNAKNIYVTNLYTHVAVAVNARIRAPEETNNSLEVRTNRNLFCEALPWIANAWSSTVNSMGFVEKGMVDFTIENSYLGLDAASTDDERKTALVKYFTAKPCRVVHRIATPIETPLTPAEIAAYKALTVYAPDTVVQAIDGAGLKLEYQRDVNIVIKNLEDAIASMTAT
jgi:hypothetical protein|nr:MAG TPA: nucleoid-associated protein [Caudoviricetes sp.]